MLGHLTVKQLTPECDESTRTQRFKRRVGREARHPGIWGRDAGQARLRGRFGHRARDFRFGAEPVFKVVAVYLTPLFVKLVGAVANLLLKTWVRASPDLQSSLWGVLQHDETPPFRFAGRGQKSSPGGYRCGVVKNVPRFPKQVNCLRMVQYPSRVRVWWHVSANENRGGARFDHDFGSSRFFMFANSDFMTDALQDLNLRSVVGGGIGYHFIDRDNATLNLLGGANFTRENYAEVQRNLAAGQVGEELTLKLGKSTSLVQNLAFFPGLTKNERGDYRSSFSLGTITKISKWLGWQNNFSDVYVTNPPAGKKQNELVFTSGLHVAFVH